MYGFTLSSCINSQADSISHPTNISFLLRRRWPWPWSRFRILRWGWRISGSSKGTIRVGRGRGSVGSDPVTPFAPEPPRHPSLPPPQQSQPHFQSQQQPRSQPPPRDESQGSPRPQFSGEEQPQPQPHSPTPPVFVKLQEIKGETSVPPSEFGSGQAAPPNNIFNALGNEFQSNPGSGAGRGKPPVESAPIQHEDNRHIRRPQPYQQYQRSQSQQRQRARPPRDETPLEILLMERSLLRKWEPK
ncbi:unnamed protein product [Microthlaspi erraticum]|uniref:Uncharacterized protein n=1 Tax=Microthlaspi erraticum TaxID=1685480 RepID=A0A6D2HE61_9BRAS|nr:unnamed protein product [Microthlaspi erraticum]